MAGFTTVRDLGTYRAFVDVALRDAIDRGIVPGPRMAVAGAYVTVGGAIVGFGATAGWEPAAAIAIAFAVTLVVGAGGVALSRRLLPENDPGVAARS